VPCITDAGGVPEIRGAWFPVLPVLLTAIENDGSVAVA
jgi:hypothetical protein